MNFIKYDNFTHWLWSRATNLLGIVDQAVSLLSLGFLATSLEHWGMVMYCEYMQAKILESLDKKI